MVDQGRRRQSRGVVDIDNLVLRGINLIRYVGHGGDYVHVELPEEPLLNYLQMEQPEETAAETASQRQ